MTTGLDSGARVAHTMWHMGDTATVLGLRQATDRGFVMGQSDDELIAGVRAGEASAFEEIYDRYARGILAFCAHMLGSRDAAEDALQVTFVSAYRALRAGENSIALRPWLYTIARNRCLSELRARRDALGVDELASGHPVFEGLTDQVQRREDLREMLDDMQRLPADQRAALVLFELGDHPQKEIASVLGVRTEKVKALVFQAREALVRGRQARQHPCGDIREQLATMEGRVPARGLLRAHIDRCPGCQSFEHEVHHQRAALALILPVALAGELKTSILGSVLHGGGGAVAAACGGGGGAIAVGGGGGAAAGAGACGGGAVVGGAVGGVSAIGGATAAGGLGSGIGAVSAAAGSVATAGVGAVATSAPVVAAATGLAAIGESVGVGSLSASGVVAKILTAAAIATVAASTGHSDHLLSHHTAPPTMRERLLASVPARPAARTTEPVSAPVAISAPSPGTVSSTPAGTTSSSSSSTPATSGGATSTSTAASSGSSTTADLTPTGSLPAASATPQSAPSGPDPGTSPSSTANPSPGGGSAAASGSGGGAAPSTASPAPTSDASAAADTPAAADPTSSAPPATSGDATASGTDTTSTAPDTTDAGAASTDPSSTSSDPSTPAAQTTSPAGGPTTPAVDQTAASPADQSSSAAQATVSAAAAPDQAAAAAPDQAAAAAPDQADATAAASLD